MKSTVTPRDEKQVITYPCLMIAEDGDIVFFIAEGEGVVVNIGQKSETRSFEYDRSWIMTKFTPFHGTVTLEND